MTKKRALSPNNEVDSGSTKEKNLYNRLLAKIEEKRQCAAKKRKLESDKKEVGTSYVPETPNTNGNQGDDPKISNNEDELLEKLLIKANKKKYRLEKERKDSVQKEPTPSNVEELQPEQNVNLQIEPVVDKLPADLSECGFQILGKQTFEQRRKVKDILPPWLAYPSIISNTFLEDDQGPLVEDLHYLSERLRHNLAEAGVKRLFPVQTAVIPWILKTQSRPAPFWPRDVCCSAPTGSGKTLAFAVPVVQLLLNRLERKIRVLVILPVQELAEQVANVFRQLCLGTKIVPILLSKSTPLNVERSRLLEKINEKYYSKVDIVITTAGRLVEHLHSTNGFSLKSLQYLIIDEADRIMDQIQNDWLYHLNKHVKTENDSYIVGKSISLSVASLRSVQRPPRKLLFSATLSEDPEKIQQFKLFQPKLFSTIVPKLGENTLKELPAKKSEIRGDFVGKFTTPAELTEKFCIVNIKQKPLAVYALIKKHNWRRFLCFTNRADSAHRLSFVLQKLFGSEMVVEELSSTLSVQSRKSVLSRFFNYKVNGLISTDALARGIDIPNVDVVISYDLPKHIKTYIHRVGRTARAGQSGTAITMVEPFQLKLFQKLLSTANKFNVDEVKTDDNIEEEKAIDYNRALKDLEKALEHELRLKKRKMKKQETSQKTFKEIIEDQFFEEGKKALEGPIPEAWCEEALSKQPLDVGKKKIVKKPKQVKNKTKE